MAWKDAYRFDLMEFFGEYHQNPGYSLSYRTRYDELITMVEARLPKGSRIIDVAAAQGNFSIGLAERGYRVVWNDIREELLGYVQLKHEFGDLTYTPGNAFDLNENQFDGAVICEVIEHVAHPDLFLEKIAKLVKPGGFVFMTTPNGAYFRNKLPRFSECDDPNVFESVQFKPDADGHIFLLHRDEIITLSQQSGLDIVDMNFFTNPLTAGQMKLNILHQIFPQNLIKKIERLSRTELPSNIGEKILTQVAVCFQKPATSAR